MVNWMNGIRSRIFPSAERLFALILGTVFFMGALAVPAQQTDPARAEQVMKALAAAYPDQIGAAVSRAGDWAVPVRGEWFYYAQGRLLPEALRGRAPEYDPQAG